MNYDSNRKIRRKVMSVIVSGFVPRREIGEMEYNSAIYHVFTNEKGNPRFLVWNPYLNDMKGNWDIVGTSCVRPAVFPSQSLKTKQQHEALKRLVEIERREERQDDEQG